MFDKAVNNETLKTPLYALGKNLPYILISEWFIVSCSFLVTLKTCMFYQIFCSAKKLKIWQEFCYKSKDTI